MSAENEEIIEETLEDITPVKAKRPRTQAQLDALKRARERAVEARKQYAKERRERMCPEPEPEPETEPEPEPVREPSPEPDFTDEPLKPSIDKDTIYNIIGEYKAEKKRLKEAQPRKKFSLHPSGYYIYDP